MVPPGHFNVVAEVVPGREAALRNVLARMNGAPGQADPDNGLVPFGHFGNLHFARFAILQDDTRGDLDAYGTTPAPLPTYLVFLGDCDGPAERQLDEFARAAEPGLRAVFDHCAGFTAATPLAAWLRAHDSPVAAAYANWPGRSVRREREERELARALGARLRSLVAGGTGELQSLRTQLLEFVAAERRLGRLALSPDPPVPLSWRLRDALHLVGVPLLGVLALPLLVVYLPLFAWQLRAREIRDPEIAPRPRADHVARLASQEDHDVTNAFTALGSVKPGLFRRGLVTVLLVLLDWSARHVYVRGHLTRVQTIHFARWVFLDDRQRLLFASNYDGSLESYMDDFINKVAWGLNLVFGNGAGYPRTRWLVQGGARNAQVFKDFLRRHQVATDVWYNAFPGSTALDLARHGRIREGLEQVAMNDEEIAQWLRLLAAS